MCRKSFFSIILYWLKCVSLWNWNMKLTRTLCVLFLCVQRRSAAKNMSQIWPFDVGKSCMRSLKTFSCRESHRTQWFETKKIKKAIVVHHGTHMRYLCTTRLWFSRVLSRYARGLSLNTTCDMCREGNSCGLVETRWEHVLCVCSGDDITHSMTSTWPQWKGRGEVRGRAHTPQVFNYVLRLIDPI